MDRRTSSRPRALAGVFVLAWLIAGCGGAQDGSAASTANRFLAAVHGGDGRAACDLLAPPARDELARTTGEPCRTSILTESFGSGTSATADVDVFDTMAKASVGSQTLFLTKFDGRWLVMAAACTAVPERPYECTIGLP